MKKEENVIKTSLQVPRLLWKTIKNVAFDRGVSTNDVVVEALQKAWSSVGESEDSVIKVEPYTLNTFTTPSGGHGKIMGIRDTNDSTDGRGR